jgi:hypothetical protein
MHLVAVHRPLAQQPQQRVFNTHRHASLRPHGVLSLSVLKV